MALVLVGVSHKSAPLELREKLSFSKREDLESAYKDLLALPGLNEAVILSTCNRTEIYADIDLGINGIGLLVKFLSKKLEQGPCALLGYTYGHSAMEVAFHLFSVVSSLDSMVLGEAQILGQVRRAYSIAESSLATKTMLNQLFRQALEVGKRVRSQTMIGASSVSISTAAVQLAESVFSDLKRRKILLLGAGEMAELAAQYLKERGADSIHVINRTYLKAKELAVQVGGQAHYMHDLIGCLSVCDIVISSTSSEDYAISYKELRAAKKNSKGNSLLIIDIALPRDVDPKAGKLDDVYLYDLDDLQSLVEQGYESRRQEAEEARKIIEEELDAYKRWLQERSVIPTIAHMRQKAEKIRDKELARAYKRLGSLGEQEREVIEAMANSIITKMLHGPFARLRKDALDPEAYVFTQAARYLFGLDTNPDGEVPDACRQVMLRAHQLRQDQQLKEGEKKE